MKKQKPKKTVPIDSLVKREIPFTGTYLRCADAKGRIPLPPELRQTLRLRQQTNEPLIFYRIEKNGEPRIELTDVIKGDYPNYFLTDFDSAGRIRSNENINEVMEPPTRVEIRGMGKYIEIKKYNGN